jgi:hypothetical protein
VISPPSVPEPRGVVTPNDSGVESVDGGDRDGLASNARFSGMADMSIVGKWEIFECSVEKCRNQHCRSEDLEQSLDNVPRGSIVELEVANPPCGW